MILSASNFSKHTVLMTESKQKMKQDSIFYSSLNVSMKTGTVLF